MKDDLQRVSVLRPTSVFVTLNSSNLGWPWLRFFCSHSSPPGYSDHHGHQRRHVGDQHDCVLHSDQRPKRVPARLRRRHRARHVQLADRHHAVHHRSRRKWVALIGCLSPKVTRNRPRPLGNACGVGYLEYVSEKITENIGSDPSGGGEIKMLNVITEPFTQLVIQVSRVRSAGGRPDLTHRRRPSPRLDQQNGHRRLGHEQHGFRERHPHQGGLPIQRERHQDRGTLYVTRRHQWQCISIKQLDLVRLRQVNSYSPIPDWTTLPSVSSSWPWRWSCCAAVWSP